MRTILVPIESGVHYETARDHLCRLAPLYGSRTLGLQVIDTFDLEKELGDREEARRLLERDARLRVEAFERECRDKGIASSGETVIGETVEEIALYAQRSDLLLIGEALSDEEGLERRQRRVRAVLHRLTRPLLIAREGYEKMRRIVMGYDGCEKGGHALQWSADLAERASAELVFVVCADTREMIAQLAEEAEAYLDAYRIHRSVRTAEGHPGEALAQTARQSSADLVVVGSHGHGRLHEMAFGSTTRYVLENVPMSLLIWR